MKVQICFNFRFNYFVSENQQEFNFGLGELRFMSLTLDKKLNDKKNQLLKCHHEV